MKACAAEAYDISSFLDLCTATIVAHDLRKHECVSELFAGNVAAFETEKCGMSLKMQIYWGGGGGLN